MKIARYMILVLLAGIFSFADASAYGSGISGRSTSGCGGSGCHASSSSTNTSVSITSQSGSFTVPTGGTLNLTAIVAHSSQPKAGVNISVTSGTLSPGSGSGLTTESGELKHSSKKDISGGQATWDFTYTAPSTAGTYSLRAAGNAVNNNNSADNGDQWNIMSAISITVTANPTVTVTSPTASTSWCAGSTQNITWTSAAIQNVKIELSPDGGSNYTTTLVASTAASAGSWSWNIPANLAPATSYRVKISDASNSNVFSESQNFTIAAGPTIVTQPASQVKCTNQTATFTVSATGAGLTYQWRKDNVNISNATSSTLSVPVLSSSGGSYDVVVTACNQSVTSQAASLTVNISPFITQNLDTALTLCAGQTATITIQAGGDGITYKWRKNNTVIQNATTATLNIPAVSVADTGSYTVEVSGTCTPSVVSTALKLRVNVPPAITTQPAAKTVVVGAQASFSVAATGTAIKYQWRKNGMNIPNATNATYTINSVTMNDNGGLFDVVVSNSCSTIVSSVVELHVTQPGAGAVFNVPSSVDFGKVGVNLSTEQTISVGNTGDSTLKVTSVTLNSSDFTIVSGGGAFNVEPNGAPHAIKVKFAPASSGSKTATLSFTSNAKTTPSVVLNGNAAEQKVALSMNNVAFGNTVLNEAPTMTVELTNNSDIPVTITTMQQKNQNSAFTLKKSFTFPHVLETSGKISLDFEFKPTEEKEYRDTFEIEIAGLQPIQVFLSGTGKIGSGVVENPTIISEYSVSPNPASDKVSLSFSLKRAGWAKIEIVDAQGRLIRNIGDIYGTNDNKFSFVWDGRSDNGATAANGIYRAVIRTESGAVAIPIVITK